MLQYQEITSGTRAQALARRRRKSKEQQDDWTLPLKQLYYDTLVASGA